MEGVRGTSNVTNVSNGSMDAVMRVLKVKERKVAPSPLPSNNSIILINLKIRRLDGFFHHVKPTGFHFVAWIMRSSSMTSLMMPLARMYISSPRVNLQLLSMPVTHSEENDETIIHNIESKYLMTLMILKLIRTPICHVNLASINLHFDDLQVILDFLKVNSM